MSMDWMHAALRLTLLPTVPNRRRQVRGLRAPDPADPDIVPASIGVAALLPRRSAKPDQTPGLELRPRHKIVLGRGSALRTRPSQR